MELPHKYRVYALLFLLGAMAVFTIPGAAAIDEGVAVRSGATVAEGGETTFRVWWGHVTDTSERVTVTCAKCGATYVLNLTTPNGTDSGAERGRRFNDVKFPTHFPAALAAGEPMWNGTYTIRVASDDTPSETDNPTATFSVWLADVHRFPGGTMRVTESLKITATGFASSSVVTLRLDKINYAGARAEVETVTVTTSSSGGFSYLWLFSKSYSVSLQCANESCWRHFLTVSHASKLGEEITFRVRPSNVTTQQVTGPGFGEESGTVNRTGAVRAFFRLTYQNGEPLASGHNATGGVRASFATVDALGRTTTIANHTMAPVGGSNNWVLNAAINRSAPLTDSTGFPKYRILIPRQLDTYGNTIDSASSVEFTVSAATIGVTPIQQPNSVGRLQWINLTFVMGYGRESAMTADDNASALRFDLVRQSDQRIAAVLVANYTRNILTWNVSHKLPLDFADLGDYKLRLQAGQDRFGNRFDSFESRLFAVSVARQNVSLSTLVGGDEAGTPSSPLRRLDRVDVLAFVTYPDGSPLNASRLPASSSDHLVLNITKVGTSGEVTGFLDLQLTLVDPGRGKFAGSFTIPSMREDPIGDWLFRLDVRDKVAPAPNEVSETFARTVRGALIAKTVLREPDALSLAGSDPVRYSIQLKYKEAPGTAVDPSDVAGSIYGTVVVLLGQGQSAEVAGPFPMEFNPSTGAHEFVWRHERSSQISSYQIRVEATDRFGNELEETASATFRLFVEQVPRAVIAQPTARVPRGAEATVVFEGAEGDVGEEGSALARIEVQKYNPARGSWELRLRDATLASAEGEAGFHHVGTLRTNLSTAEGVYRFALIGRNRTFATLVANSENFTVETVSVQREVLQPPAPRVVKGNAVSVEILREPRDAPGILEVWRGDTRVTFRGVVVEAAKFIGSWEPGERVENGEYTLRFRGRDGFSNTIDLTLGNVTVEPLDLEVIPLRAPAPVLGRSSEANTTFQVRYPSQTLLTGAEGTPAVNVYGPSGLVGPATVVSAAGAVWRASWAPNTTLEVGRYELRVEGTDNFGNRLVNNGSLSFDVVEGFAARRITFSSNFINRTEDIAIFGPFDPSDEFVEFAVVDARSGERVATIDHTTDAAGGRYIARWRTAPSTPLAAYGAVMTGKDGFGNEIRGVSQQFGLQRATVVPFIFEGAVEIIAGDFVTYSFTLTYPDGSPMTPQLGTPLVTIGRGVTPDPVKPELNYEGGRWFAKWTSSTAQKPTLYRLVIGGQDNYGNQIFLGFSQPLAVRAGLIKEILGVPDVSPPIVLLGVALLSLAVKRRLR